MAVQVGKAQNIGSAALGDAVEAAGAALVWSACRIRIGWPRGSRSAAVATLGRDGQIEGASRDSGSEDSGEEDGELHFGSWT